MNAESRHRIEVSAESLYLAEHSEPEEERFVFAYTITIRNVGDVAAQLLSRHWVITDANGNVEEVRGEGVVGKQPRLEPGEGFQYTSAAAIATPVGSMQGSYQMQAEDGEAFDAEIPVFGPIDAQGPSLNTRYQRCEIPSAGEALLVWTVAPRQVWSAPLVTRGWERRR